MKNIIHCLDCGREAEHKAFSTFEYYFCTGCKKEVNEKQEIKLPELELVKAHHHTWDISDPSGWICTTCGSPYSYNSQVNSPNIASKNIQRFEVVTAFHCSKGNFILPGSSIDVVRRGSGACMSDVVVHNRGYSYHTTITDMQFKYYCKPHTRAIP